MVSPNGVRPVFGVSISILAQFGDNVTFGSRGGEQPQPSIRTMAINWDEEDVAKTTNVYNGPQPYNFEPSRHERANEELPRPDGRQRQLNGWSEENEWRVGEVSW